MQAVSSSRSVSVLNRSWQMIDVRRFHISRSRLQASMLDRSRGRVITKQITHPARRQRIDVIPPRPGHNHLLVQAEGRRHLVRSRAGVAAEGNRRVALLAKLRTAPELEHQRPPSLGRGQIEIFERLLEHAPARLAHHAEVGHLGLHVGLHAGGAAGIGDCLQAAARPSGAAQPSVRGRPSSAHRAVTESRTSGVISIMSGQPRSYPSAGDFAVASIPSFPPTNWRDGAWSR